MHRVIAGCNLWALVFLATAFGLGASHSPRHQAVGIFAVVFAMLAQSAIFALFMGASKLLQEHVARFRLDAVLIERCNRIMIPLFRWAFAGSTAVVGVALAAGLAASGEVPVLVHAAAGVAAMGVLAVAVRREVKLLAGMHDVLLAMEQLLPEPVGEPKVPAMAGDEIDLRPRALVYVGSTVLAMTLGYRYISGLKLPPTAVPLAIVFAVGSIVAAAVLHHRSRRSASTNSSAMAPAATGETGPASVSDSSST